MNDFKVNDFIEWSASDDQTPFTMVGQVKELTDERITFMVAEGPMYSTTFDDGVFRVIKRPKSWPELVDSVEILKPVKEQPKVKKAAARKKGGPTKVDLIVELLEDDPPSSRKEAIKRIVDAGISTPAGASTFYHQAKGRLS